MATDSDLFGNDTSASGDEELFRSRDGNGQGLADSDLFQNGQGQPTPAQGMGDGELFAPAPEGEADIGPIEAESGQGTFTGWVNRNLPSVSDVRGAFTPEGAGAVGTAARSSISELLKSASRREARDPYLAPVTEEEYQRSFLAGKLTPEQKRRTLEQNRKEQARPLEAAGEAVAPSREQYAEAQETLGRPAMTLTELGASAAPFFAGGPLWAAGLGMATGQGEFVRDAEQSGATAEEMLEAESYGGLAGAGQSLPVFQAFGRLGSRIGGRKLAELADRLPAGDDMRFLGRAAATGVAEAGQETLLYEVPKNLVARDLIGYDPNRNIWQGMPELAAGSFTVGAATQAILEGAYGRRLARYQRAQGEQQARTTGELDIPYFLRQTEKVTEGLQGTFNDRRLRRATDQPERIEGERDVMREVAGEFAGDSVGAETVRTAVQDRMFPMRDDTELADADTETVQARAELQEQLEINRRAREDAPSTDIRQQLDAQIGDIQARLDALPGETEAGSFAREWQAPIARPGARQGLGSEYYFGHTEGTVDLSGVNITRLKSDLFERGPMRDGRYVAEDMDTQLERTRQELDAVRAARNRWLAAERRRTNADAEPAAAKREMATELARLNPNLNADRLAGLDDINFTRFVDSRLSGLEDRAAQLQSMRQGTRGAGDGWQRVLARKEIVRAAQRGQPKVRFSLAPESGLSARTQEFLRKEYGAERTTDASGREWLELVPPDEYAGGIFMQGSMAPDVAEHWQRVKQGYERLQADASQVMANDMASFGKGKQTWMNILQIGREFPDSQGLQEYQGLVRRWWQDKMWWTERADARIQDWRKLGKARGGRLSEFTFDVAQDSFERGRRLTPEEIDTWARRHNVDGDMIALWQEMESDFAAALDTLEEIMVSQVDRTLDPAVSPTANARQKMEIQEELAKLRDQNYFPFSRFGPHIVIVRDAADNVLHRQHFERRWKAKKFQRNIKGALTQGQQAIYTVEDTAQQMTAGVPEALKQKIESDLSLSPEQKQAFGEMLVALSPARSYAKNLLKRKGTPGFSQNAMRSYADYFQRFSNHIARIKNYPGMVDAQRKVQAEARELGQRTGDASVGQQLSNWVDNHIQYLMNPQSEWAAMRSITSLFYLGFVPASAVVNLTQLALTTYPFLSARYGGTPGLADVRTIGEMTRAASGLALDKAMRGAEKIFARAQRDASEMFANPGVLEGELVEGLQRAVREGIIDESLATELAAAATQSGAEAYVPTGFWGRTGRTYARGAMWLFQGVEKLNRRVTFMAAWRLARRQYASGKPWHLVEDNVKEQIYSEAKDAIERTQYEYARWNRPRFMRGRAGVIFMFWQHVQNTLHFFQKEPGRGRAWMVQMMLGGLLGLPFAEDILDLLDSLFTQFPQARKLFGLSEKPMTDLRHEGREVLNDLTDDERLTDLMLHGMSREYGLGPVHLMGLAGMPIPNVDLSGSTSFGDIVPGTRAARSLAQGREVRDVFMQGSEDVLGATAGIFGGLMQAVTTDDVGILRRFEEGGPRFSRRIMESTRWAREGAVESYRGAELFELDLNSWYDRSLLALNAAGFRVTPLVREQELRWTQYEHARFYEGRRGLILQQLFKAVKDGNEDGIKEAHAERKRFNSTVPNAQLRIGPETILNSLTNRYERLAREEAGLPDNDRFIQDYIRIRDSFPEIDRRLQEDGIKPPARIERP